MSMSRDSYSAVAYQGSYWCSSGDSFRSEGTRRTSDLSLNLFQSLDEYSSCVEPVSNSSYECRPSSSEEMRAQGGACPRSIGDIWSQDSISTIDSGIYAHPANDRRVKHAPGGFTDYSHMLGHFPTAGDHSESGIQPERFTGRFSTEQRPVILQLSNLIW